LNVNTNTIEGFWRHMKDPIKRALGTSQDLLPSYIDEGVFRYNHGTGNTLVKAFWNEIRAEFTFGGEDSS
jgi:hypothetical protein